MSLRTDNLFNVKGKTVLVTGGSRGIGKMVRVHLFTDDTILYSRTVDSNGIHSERRQGTVRTPEPAEQQRLDN
jgi:NAD(P)-dependent dehydrogenase (short-subunit alcohol dehydrogenase family)